MCTCIDSARLGVEPNIGHLAHFLIFCSESIKLTCQEAPPTRIAAKIDMAAALLKGLNGYETSLSICVGCSICGFWRGYCVHVWTPASNFPPPHCWTRSLELFPGTPFTSHTAIQHGKPVQRVKPQSMDLLGLMCFRRTDRFTVRD